MEIRAVGREDVPRNAIGRLWPPGFVEDGMVRCGMVCDDDDAPTAPSREGTTRLEQRLNALGMEAIGLPATRPLAVPQADRANGADAATGRRVPHDGIGVLRGSPQATARALRLARDGIRGPPVNVRITHQSSECCF
jgi:hypothetical protein